MDAVDFMQNLFCCMFPLRQRRRRTRVSAPLKRMRRPRSEVGRGADRHQRLVWLHSRANYVDLKNRILAGISYDTSKTLVVWCPQNVVSSDFVVTMLHRCGEIQHFMENYTNKLYLGSRQMVWAGSIVEYSSRQEASIALKEIPMKCRHVRILPLEFILLLIADCELLYGAFDRSSASTVIISGRRSLECVETFYLRTELSLYGEIDKLLFNYQLRNPGVVCRVSYPYLTQAYLAMTMLEGSRRDNVLLSAEIEKCGKDEEIIEEARKTLMVVMETYFPN